MQPIELGSLEYKCWHELGHVATAHSIGLKVDFVKVDDDEHGDKICVSRCEKRDARSSRLVAAGGFASELILFRRGLIVDSENRVLATKEFIDQSNDNAHHDKASFFGVDLRVDGQWPEENDNEFMEFAHANCVPLLEPKLDQLRKFAVSLAKEKYMDQSQIALQLQV